LNQTLIDFELAGVELASVGGIFSKSEGYYFTLQRMLSDSHFVKVYDSEIVSDTQSPQWKGFKVRLSKLCNLDP